MPLVDEFAARLFGELDYVQEGKNCEKFGRLYRWEVLGFFGCLGWLAV